jgi:hypothetical protein
VLRVGLGLPQQRLGRRVLPEPVAADALEERGRPVAAAPPDVERRGGTAEVALVHPAKAILEGIGRVRSGGAERGQGLA